MYVLGESKGFQKLQLSVSSHIPLPVLAPATPRNGFTEAPLTLSLKRAANRSRSLFHTFHACGPCFFVDFPKPHIGSMGLVDLPTVHLVDFLWYILGKCATHGPYGNTPMAHNERTLRTLNAEVLDIAGPWGDWFQPERIPWRSL